MEISETERIKWRMDTNIFSLLSPDEELQETTEEVKRICDRFIENYYRIKVKYPKSCIDDSSCRESMLAYLSKGM